MDRSVSLGKIVSGDQLFEISLELHDVSGAAYPLPKIDAQLRERTRKIAYQMISEYGKKYQGTYGTPDYLSDEGIQVGNITIGHQHANTEHVWNQFKSTLIRSSPELQATIQRRGFGLRMAPLPAKEYFPLLETIRHKLEHRQCLTKDEENELQWFGERAGSQHPAIIRANIVHYFLEEEPSLGAILPKLRNGHDLNAKEKEKFEVFKAWYAQLQQLRGKPVPNDLGQWIDALEHQLI